MADDEERRRHERKGVKVQRLVRAAIDFGEGASQSYLYLVDLSDGGMRVNSDLPFPADRPARIAFTLQYLDLDAQVSPVWQKSLAGGMWTTGLAFRDLSAEQAAGVRAMFAAFSVAGRRERFRLKNLVTVTIRRADNPRWDSCMVIDLSPTGLRARFDEMLDPDQELDVIVFPPDCDEVPARARVAWRREAGPHRCEFGLQFVAIAEEGTATLQRYIDACVGA